MRSSITPKKPSRGRGNRALVGRLGRALRAPGAKWRASTLLGKQCTFGWRSSLRAVQAGPAGEDDVGASAAARPRARATAAARRGRPTARPCSRRPRARARAPRERQRHRRVEPGDVVPHLLPAHQQVQHLREPREVAAEAPVFGRDDRPADAQPRRRELHVPRVGDARLRRDRLLDEEHEPPAGETRDQMLGALVDGIPSQVRVDHQGELGHATPRRFPGTRLAVSIP